MVGVYMNKESLFKITYGLYVLTARDNNFDNGCIINTVMQVTESPLRIVIAVSKENKTHDMIMNTGIFNITSLSEKAEFSIFEHFGMNSGNNIDKFKDYESAKRSNNGLYYIFKMSNMFLSCMVFDKIDLGTHTMFIADVVDGEVISQDSSCTYDYYHKNIKPKPRTSNNKSWVCEICGYVYEGDELPDDYICPLCKHGADAFKLCD